MQWKRFVRALKDGCTLTIGTDHHRIRIVRIEDGEGKLKGYGESGRLAEALTQAVETYRRGLGTFEEEFPNGRVWLSGVRSTANAFDGLLLRRAYSTATAHENGFLARIELEDHAPVVAVRASFNRAVRAAVRDMRRLRAENLERLRDAG